MSNHLAIALGVRRKKVRAAPVSASSDAIPESTDEVEASEQPTMSKPSMLSAKEIVSRLMAKKTAPLASEEDLFDLEEEVPEEIIEDIPEEAAPTSRKDLLRRILTTPR